MRERNRQFQYHAKRPNDPENRTDHESQADKPPALRPNEQKIRNELREQQHFHQDVDKGLRQCVPRPGNKHDDAARGLRRDHDQPQIREQTESGSCPGAFQAEVRLDLGFEDFEMIVHVARRDAAQFAVNPVEVGEHHQTHTERRHGQHIEESHHLQSIPNRRRRRRSRRSISPWSLS